MHFFLIGTKTKLEYLKKPNYKILKLTNLLNNNVIKNKKRNKSCDKNY